MAGVKKRSDPLRKASPRRRRKPAGGAAPETLHTIVVGGNAGYRRAVLRLLKNHPRIAVAGSAGSAVETEALLEQCRPQLALIDVRLPDCSGFELVHRVKQKHAGMKVVLIAAEDDEEYRDAAARAGADGLACRNNLAQQLPAWIEDGINAPGSRRGRKGAQETAMPRTASTADEKAWNRFRSTFNQAAVGIMHSTTEGWILEANRSLCEMLGYASAELRTRNTRDLTHPDDRDRQDVQRRELLDGSRGSFSSEKRYVRKDGRVIWVNRTVALAYETPGADPYLIQTIEDITERKRAEAELARVTRARRVLADGSHALVHAANEPDLLGEMCRIIVESGGYRQGWIGLVNDDPARPVLPVAHAGYRDDSPMASPESRSLGGDGQGVGMKAITTGETVIVRDILNQSAHPWRRARALKHGFQSSIALLLKGDGRTLGVLVMHASEPDAYNGEEIALLTTLADDIGYGMVSLRADAARREAEARLARLSRARKVMAECSQVLVHATDESRLLHEMCRIAVESGGFRQAWVAAVIGDTPLRVRAAAHAGYGDGTPMTGASNWAADGSYRGLAAEAITGGGICIARDILNDSRQERKRGRALQLNYQSSIALPLKEQERSIGALVLHAAERDAFDDEEITLLDGLAADLAYGIANLRTQQARQQAERRLRESEQQVREIFDQAAVGITRTDLDGVLVEVNSKFCSLLGYAREELLGRSVKDITHPDDYGRGSRVREALHSGKRMEAYSGEKRFLRKDGTPIWVRRTLSATYDDAGKPKYVIAIIEDITERKELEQRHLETFDQAAVGIAHTSADGVYLRVNRKFCEILGYDESELVGSRAADITHPDDRGRGGEYRQLLWDGKLDKFSEEKRYLRKDGTVVWTNRTVSLARRFSGEPMYFIRVIEDITERKALEHQFRGTFEQAAVGIFHADLNGRYLRVNRKFCEITGYSEEELTGPVRPGLSYPGDFDSGRVERKRLLSGEIESHGNEKRYVRKDGRVIWVARTESVARDESGRPLYLIRVVEEITGRKAAEERYRATFDNAPMGIMHTAIDSYRILRANRRLSEMLGYTQEELLGMSSTDFVHPDYRFKDTSRYKDQMVGGGLQTFSSERKFVRKDGSSFWVNRTVSLVNDASGKPDYFIRIVEDITERKHAEEAIASERALLRTVVDAVPDRIYVKDREGRFLLQNMANARAHGVSSPEDLLGKTEFDVLPREAAERIEAEDRAILASGVPLIEREQSTKDQAGSTYWIAASKVPLHGAGGDIVGIVGVNRDITERRISAQRREMEHAVTRVLAESATVQEAVPELIRTICEAMGWAYGARWVWSEESQTLVRSEFWSDFTPDFSGLDETPWRKLRFRNPGGLLRRAWYQKQPTWLADIRHEPSFNRKEAALGFGLHSAYSFPVIAGTEVVGVMEFFGREPRQPDDMLLQISESVGRQIGQFIQRKQAEAALKESEQQFRQLAGNIPQVFWITDVDQKETIYVSPAWEEVTGRPLDQLKSDARSWLDSVHEEDRARVRNARKAAGAGGYDESFRIVRPDGSFRWVHDRAFPVADETGRVYRIAGIAEDVTERKQAETQLMQLAHYDVLTSLPNRVLFYDRLKQALAQAKRNQWIVGVLFIDVDRFKNVNDTLGHAVGDQLLQQVSERLTGAVRAGDTVGRLGGDEFSIVLSNLTSAQDASLVAQKIMAGFNVPFKLSGTEIYVTASIGITLYPDDSLDQDALIKNADAAMYRAKELGRNSYQFYTPEMNARAQELLGMESSLRRALDHDEFLLHFQPKASASTGEITGVEALLRWQHPERGMVAPAEFIPVLEETGLITPVGEWVIKAACEQVKAWQRAGIEPVPVAVNLSARQFQSPRLGANIIAAIEASGIEPRLLEIEITESSLMQNADGAISTLQHLKSYGLRVSIDDFGTGYSSLSYLKRFPLDALKIDRSFVRDINTDLDDATITRAVISMAHSLGLKVIAEGVETESQLEFLAEHGCDEIQGYYFSRPLTAEDCGIWLGEKRHLRRLPQPVESAPAVLLVDDDDDALTLLKRTLAKDGYRLLTARNAHEALDVLGKHRVDLVISDQHMPGVLGSELLRRVKRLHPKTARLMTSGDLDTLSATGAVDEGEIFRFLPKGMPEDKLRADVREALEARTWVSQDIVHQAPPGTMGK